MRKVKKIALILLIWLLSLFFISVAQNSPISIVLTAASFFQIPMIFWPVVLISPFLLYLIAKDSKNPFVPLLCSILYFFLFYSFGLYFMSHPTISDIGSSGQFQSILSSVTHIGPQEIDAERFISAARYLQWPVFFIFSKVFTSILGIGPIQTLNLGFFSILLILPVLLPLFYKRTKKVENASIYFIFPALYLTLCWHFINDQFVPQFLALVYLFTLFGCYLKYLNRKNPIFLLLIIIFYALTVFTHAFIFIFFLVAIIFEIYWSEYVEMKRPKFISYGLIIALFAMLFPYIGSFYEMASGGSGGQSWRIFQSLFSTSPTSGPGVYVQPLYQLVPRLYDNYISLITTLAIALIFLVVGIGLLIHIYHIFKQRRLFDLSVLIGSATWFALGLSQLVLGQRALQVAALPLSRHLKHPHKLFSYASKVVIVIILIAPSVFIANSMINSSVTGERLIQDCEENIAGRFMDNHFINDSIILVAQNPYPTGYPTGFRHFSDLFNDPYEFQLGLRDRAVDFVLDSPKLQKQLMYWNILLPIGPNDSVMYDNEDIKIFYLVKR